MARAPKTETAPSESRAVVNWEAEMAAQAELAAGMEANSGGGQFFSMRGGQLSFNDAPLPGNQMAVVILDSILENVFYADEYDPEQPAPPTCFAFGRDEDTQAPHPSVFAADQAQHEQCKGCPMNEWGTADKGRGKACRNTRRLGMIPAGELEPVSGRFSAYDDAEHFTSAAVGFMKLPVTSVKGYATFVKQVAGALKRPPHGIFTRIRVVPDPKTQFKVLFEPLGPVPGDLLGAIMERNKEVKATIEFPYSLEAIEKPATPARGKGKVANTRPEVKRGKKY